MSIQEDNILTRALEKKISRRSFVKWSAALGATASMSGLVMQTGAKMAVGQVDAPASATTGSLGGSIVKWRPTCCLVCHGWCHVACGIDVNGHIRKIEGAGGQPMSYGDKPIGDAGWLPIDTYPSGSPLQEKADDDNHIPTGTGYLAYALHNKGRICAKGNDGVEHLYDPDRIKYPLKRVGDRGSGKWARISWDDALEEIANVLRELAGVTTDVNGSPNGGRGVDLRHRFVHFVGRNENSVPGNFSKGYGTPNHIEHTSLCELGRHVAGRSMWGHHWSSVDMQVHKDGELIDAPTLGQRGPGGSFTLQSNEHDIDCYIEWGGNPCEAKIPHSSWANHLGDRRRRNLQGFTGPARYGRIICIDVRQSNTAAWADEHINVKPGSDGALALAIIYYVLDAANGKGSTVVRQELEKGHMGGTRGRTDGDTGYNASERLYYGLFKAEEGGIASGSSATSCPTGKSLESYLFDGEFAAALGVGNSWAAIRGEVETLTGLSTADINYLGNIFLWGNKLGSGNPQRFLNVVTDTYRGPVKHTNGVYNTRAIRALQILAPNYSAAQFGALTWAANGYVPAYVAPATSRGGYNAPGGFQSDKDWQPWTNGDFSPGIGGVPGAQTSWNANLPADQGIKFSDGSVSNKQRIDDWDYDYDVPRWRGAYKWVDQNLSPGIRHSVGLHAFTKGLGADTSKKGPYYYKNWLNRTLGTFDAPGDLDTDGFKVEAMLIHKNAPGYARPQQDNEVELLYRKNTLTNEYYLKHFWSIDIAMGDGTRFADIILPEATYLERYAERSSEGHEFNYRDHAFHRVPVYEVTGPTIGSNPVPRHMYDIRQVRAIYYELARKIEPGGAGNPDRVPVPWNGKLYDSFKWVTGDLGSFALNAAGAGTAAINDGEYANKKLFEQETAGVNLGVGAANGADMVRSHVYIWRTADTPSYWRASGFTGKESNVGETYAPGNEYKSASTKAMLNVYSLKIDTMPDIVLNNADNGVGTKLNTYATQSSGPNAGCFDGRPIYVEPIQTVSGTYPLHLTTYKVNLHVQSRTACLPRLAEVLGNSWAVIHPTTAAAAINGPVANGDAILVTSETGSIEATAKVSEKAQPGCVHISHSFGHRKGVYKVEDDEGNPNRAAFGTYLVSENGGPYKSNRVQSAPVGTPCDDWSLNLPPSAPGKGTHCNIVITNHLLGDTNTGRNMATDAIGGDQAWFETKVNIEKI